MIMLSTLPKNSLGIIKLIDAKETTKAELEFLGISIGTKVKIRRSDYHGILIESYISGKKEQALLVIKDAMKVLVTPL